MSRRHAIYLVCDESFCVMVVTGKLADAKAMAAERAKYYPGRMFFVCRRNRSVIRRYCRGSCLAELTLALAAGLSLAWGLVMLARMFA